MQPPVPKPVASARPPPKLQEQINPLHGGQLVSGGPQLKAENQASASEPPGFTT